MAQRKKRWTATALAAHPVKERTQMLVLPKSLQRRPKNARRASALKRNEPKPQQSSKKSAKPQPPKKLASKKSALTKPSVSRRSVRRSASVLKERARQQRSVLIVPRKKGKRPFRKLRPKRIIASVRKRLSRSRVN